MTSKHYYSRGQDGNIYRHASIDALIAYCKANQDAVYIPRSKVTLLLTSGNHLYVCDNCCVVSFDMTDNLCDKPCRRCGRINKTRRL